MTNVITKIAHGFLINFALPLVLLLAATATAYSQDSISAKSKAVYEQIKAVALTGGSAEARGLVLKRDRAEMSFDGVFYFAPPVEGRVTCAVFIGTGKFRAEVPPGDFEKDNVKRLLGADVVESDFKTAVLRFTDDTFDIIGQNRREGGAVVERAAQLAADLDGRILKETGANLSARLALSILNAEKPGFFFANFDGGRRGRFSLLLDPQNRIPVANFTLNGGEKGLVFAYMGSEFSNEVWMAFFSLEDYQRGTATYSDLNDLIDITHYDMDVDVRDPSSRLGVIARIAAKSRYPEIRAVSFQVGESLGEQDRERLKKQLRLKSARVGGIEVAAAQEEWESGLTIFLPRALQDGQAVELELALEGDFMRDSPYIQNCFYPASNTSWYPRHGYLDRATYALVFRHRKSRRVAGAGLRISEEPDPESKDFVITKYRMDHPVPITTFAVGPFERHTQMVKWEKGGEPIPVEFNSLPSSYLPIKEDFILAEMDNSLRYFSLLFGKYPYPVFSAAFHPFGFGQGLPGLLMIPSADRAGKHTYSFIAHETAHQWWGDVVAWRSYRDQWLSEGFAEYSGILYTGIRESADARTDLVNDMRRSLREPPRTISGMGKGRLEEVGPIILGHRLSTSKTGGAYQMLIYNKGALVLRMLHFLMSNPSNGDDKAFFTMMSDFVERHRDGVASTDDFRVVANEHFVKTPIAQRFRLQDLNWFFSQWVYQTGLPSYKVEYHFQDAAGGAVLLSGTVTQEGVHDKWLMPLPLVLNFGGDKWASLVVIAYGPKTPFEIKLPARPKKVELDPAHWVLSEKTSTELK